MQLARKPNPAGGALAPLAAWTAPSVPWGGAEAAAEAAAAAAAGHESAAAGYGDPEWFPGDPARARASFAANLLSDAEAASVAAEPPLEFAEVRKLLKTGGGGGPSEGDPQLDPEVVATADIRTRYRVYVADGEVYSRAGLLAAFPFGALGQTPEAVFDRQVLGSFPTGPPAAAAAAGAGARGPENFDLVGSDAPFRSALPPDPRPDPAAGWPGDTGVLAAMKAKWRHRVHFVAGADGATSELRHPDKVALTKIFVGKKAWREFRRLCGVVGQLATTPVGQRLFLGGGGGGASAPLALGPAGSAEPGPEPEPAPATVSFVEIDSEPEPAPATVSFVEIDSEPEPELETFSFVEPEPEPANIGPRVTFAEPASDPPASAAGDLRAAADGLAEIAAGMAAMFSALRRQDTA